MNGGDRKKSDISSKGPQKICELRRVKTATETALKKMSARTVPSFVVRFCLTSAGATGKAFKTAHPFRSMRNERPARRLPKCCMLQIEPVCRESYSCREN